jgi:hypothetical protein
MMETTKKKASSRDKRPAALPEHLNQRLGSYALAATAAGVATLACAMPAQGAPVCKNLTADLLHTTTYPINPAGQIAAPFNVAQTTYTYFHSTTGISHFSWWNRGFFTPNSAGAKLLLGSRNLPADVPSGASIGPGGSFGKGTSYGLMFTYGNGTLFNHAHGTLKKHRGNLNLLQANYIGFQFLKAGETHYGWARLRVSLIPGNFYGTPFSFTEVHLLGFGYETTPNTAIAAGSCSGDAPQNADATGPSGKEQTKVAASSQKSLGILAVGNLGLPFRGIGN